MRKQKMRTAVAGSVLISAGMGGTRAKRHRQSVTWHEWEPRAKESGAECYIRKGGRPAIRCVSGVRWRWAEAAG